jgi:ubiquinone/menaquinone biosynthesis C-methylase UbiE
MMVSRETDKHYGPNAQDYEQRWKGYLKNTHFKLLDVLLPDMKESDIILDASCGTGLLMSQLLNKKAPFRELVLNDISPSILSFAQKRLPRDDRISFSAYPASELQFEENSFTKVVCLNALHNYSDPLAALKQFKKVMTPAGKLYLLDWNRFGWFRLINVFISWSGNETINTWNLKEGKQYLRELHFQIRYTEKWRYRYWQLFQIVAVLTPQNHIRLQGENSISSEIDVNI